MSWLTAAVLWRTLIVQCIRRHYVESFLELLSVLLLATVSLSPLSSTDVISNATQQSFSAYLDHGVQSQDGRGVYQAFAAPEDDHDDGLGHNAAFYSPDSEYNGLLMKTAFPKSDRWVLSSESELVKACSSVYFDVCVHFANNSGGMLSYTLHHFEGENPGEKGLGIGFRQPREFYQGDDDVDMFTWGSTYHAQVAINKAHIKLREGTSAGEHKITAQPFPLPKLPGNIERYRTAGFWLVSVALLLPTVSLVARLCEENTSGLREYQRLAGLSDCFYWTGHFASAFCFFLVHSALCVYCAVFQVQESKTQRAFLDRTDPWLLFSALALHSSLQLLWTMLAACLFPSMLASILAVLLLFLVLPSWVVTNIGGMGSLAEFVFRDRLSTLLSSVLPTVATYNVITILGIQNDFEGGASWGKLNRRPLGVFAVTMVDVWVLDTAMIGVVIGLIAYFSRVLPWNTSLPLHPLFFFQSSYWFPLPRVRQPPINPLVFNDKRFEHAPPDVRPIVHIEDLRVSYGSREALKRVTLQAFERQATVLVGRNGAGKTTLMNVIAGLLKPSSGAVWVCGVDVAMHTSQARNFIGYCPQRDLFFSDLTVWEHLVYFGTLKQVKPRALGTAAKNVLAMVHLEKEAQTLAKDLKRGPAKLLGIAIAVLGDPKVVLIDEPTSGLDPPNTQVVWDVLLRVRRTCSLLFSTHNMTEADVVADRVVGLAAGIVVCNASPAHLKSVYGVGYKVSLIKSQQEPFQKQSVLSLVQQYAPKAEFLSETTEQATVALHTVLSNSFDRMFRELEKGSAQLGIRSIGLTVSTLKDIYLKLTLASLSLTKAKTFARQLLPNDLGTVMVSRGEDPGVAARIDVLLWERLLFLSYRWATAMVAGWLLPLLLLVAAFQWMSRGVHEDKPMPAAVIRVPVSLGDHYPHAATFLDVDVQAWRDVAPFYQRLLQKEGAVLTLYDGTARDVLLYQAARDYVAYAHHFVLGAVFRGREFQAWFNPYAVLSRSLAFDLVSSAVLASSTADPSTRFQTTLAVHVPEIVALGRTRSSDVTTTGSLPFREDAMTRLNALVHAMAHVWALLAPLALALTAAGFVTFASAESCSGFMGLQLMTGVPGWLHCLVNACFDAFHFTWLAVPIAVAFPLYYSLEMASYHALFLVLVAYGALAILSAYAIAYWSSTISTAYAVTLGLYAVLGSLSVEACVFLARSGQDLWPLACAVVPACSVPMAFIKVVALEWTRLACEHMAVTALENMTVLRAFCRENEFLRTTYRVDPFAGLLRTPIDMCCETLSPDASVDWSPFRPTMPAVGLELCCLVAQAVVLFVYLSCRNSGRFFCTEFVGKVAPQVSLNQDIGDEADKVRIADEKQNFDQYALVAEELHKWYENEYAVCGFNLALRPDECLGLLGVHGCGKSIAAEMMCGLTSPSIGECYMGELRLSDSPRKWQSRLGYCPQEDSLLDAFSGEEILQFFGRLRGVPSEKIDHLVSCVSSVTDLIDFAPEACETYSAGTRRKLSTAVAIIGCPKVVILDDATSGIDIAGRGMIYEVLRNLTRVAASAVILTTRNTEECELVCTRVAVMAAGELKALGTIDQLRERFAAGFTLTFRLYEKVTIYGLQAVDKAVTHLFPGARQADCREGVFLYHIENRLPWSHVFSRVNKLRHWFRLESVLVAESSLDELLLGMARAELAEDAAEARRAAKEAFRKDTAVDPWGREERHRHRRRQSLREARKRERVAAAAGCRRHGADETDSASQGVAS